MKTKFYHTTSIPADFDMQKVKLALSNIGELKEFVGASLGFDIFHVKNIYDDAIFIEEIDQTVNLKIECFIISAGYIRSSFTIDEPLKDIDNLDSFTSFVMKKRDFKKSELESFDKFASWIPNIKLLNIQTLFEDIMKGKMASDDYDDMSMNADRIHFDKITKKNTCLKTIGKSSFQVSQGWSNLCFEIHDKKEIPNSDYKLISNVYNDKNLKKNQKIKVYEDEDETRYYKGDSTFFDQIICEKDS